LFLRGIARRTAARVIGLFGDHDGTLGLGIRQEPEGACDFRAGIFELDVQLVDHDGRAVFRLDAPLFLEFGHRLFDRIGSRYRLTPELLSVLPYPGRELLRGAGRQLGGLRPAVDCCRIEWHVGEREAVTVGEFENPVAFGEFHDLVADRRVHVARHGREAGVHQRQVLEMSRGLGLAVHHVDQHLARAV